MAMWRTAGQSGYITPEVLGLPKAPRVERKSQVGTRPMGEQSGYTPPCRLGFRQRSTRGTEVHITIISVSAVAKALRVEERSQMATWTTFGKSGYNTPPLLGVPNTLHRGRGVTNGYLAQTWAKGLHRPCRLSVPNALRGERE